MEESFLLAQVVLMWAFAVCFSGIAIGIVAALISYVVEKFL